MTVRLPRPPAPSPVPPPVGGKRDGPVLAWLGSMRNIAGCAGALVGVALTAAGLLEAPYWPFGVAALYAAGALAAPGRRVQPPAPVGVLDVETLRTCVAAQLSELVGRAPADVAQAARGVADALGELFDRPRLLHPGTPGTFVVERTVADYLPTALEAFLDLPPTFADSHRLDDGRTPRQVVVDQMTLLEKGIRDVTEAAARGDVSRLQAHGRFLADTFGPTELDTAPPIPPPSSPPSAPPSADGMAP